MNTDGFWRQRKSKDNPYHDYYVWRDGEEGVYPNDMNSVFGGPAWEWVPELGQYYFSSVFSETARSELGESESEKRTL